MSSSTPFGNIPPGTTLPIQQHSIQQKMVWTNLYFLNISFSLGGHHHIIYYESSGAGGLRHKLHNQFPGCILHTRKLWCGFCLQQYLHTEPRQLASTHMGSHHFVRRDNHECNGSRSCNKLQTPGLEDCIKSISPPGEGGVQDGSSDDEGRECDENSERVNGKEQGDRISRRQRFQTVLLEAIQTVFPTSLTELSNYFYTSRNLSICLNKEYQTHAM